MAILAEAEDEVPLVPPLPAGGLLAQSVINTLTGGVVPLLLRLGPVRQGTSGRNGEALKGVQRSRICLMMTNGALHMLALVTVLVLGHVMCLALAFLVGMPLWKPGGTRCQRAGAEALPSGVDDLYQGLLMLLVLTTDGVLTMHTHLQLVTTHMP